jgi:hypothetical protein
LAQPVKPPQPSGNERDETLCLDIFFPIPLPSGRLISKSSFF